MSVSECVCACVYMHARRNGESSMYMYMYWCVYVQRRSIVTSLGLGCVGVPATVLEEEEWSPHRTTPTCTHIVWVYYFVTDDTHTHTIMHSLANTHVCVHTHTHTHACTCTRAHTHLSSRPQSTAREMEGGYTSMKQRRE